MGKRQPEDHAEAADIVTGLNLPLLLEMITMEPQSVIPELISEKVKSCRDSIAFMREVTVEFQDGDE